MEAVLVYDGRRTNSVPICQQQHSGIRLYLESPALSSCGGIYELSVGCSIRCNVEIIRLDATSNSEYSLPAIYIWDSNTHFVNNSQNETNEAVGRLPDSTNCYHLDRDYHKQDLFDMEQFGYGNSNVQFLLYVVDCHCCYE